MGSGVHQQGGRQGALRLGQATDDVALEGAGQADDLERVAPEHANLRAAIAYALDHEPEKPGQPFATGESWAGQHQL